MEKSAIEFLRRDTCHLALELLAQEPLKTFNNLPKTAYIKMIDIWFIFCMVIPFVEVLLQTYIETLRARAGQCISINRHGQSINLQNTKVNIKG